jgi:hypothetical protein
MATGFGDRRVRWQDSSFEASSSNNIGLVAELEPEGVGRALQHQVRAVIGWGQWRRPGEQTHDGREAVPPKWNP